LVLNGIGALAIAGKSVGRVFEVSRESQSLGSGIEASIADAADIFGSGDYEIVHNGWEVPMDFDLVGQKILFQLGHQEQA
jgi:hypothetical protein